MGQLTYLALNLIFIIAVLLVFRIRLNLTRAMLVTAAVLLVLTAVFDSVLVSLGIVGYDDSKITGIVIGSAPVEDFMYTLLAVVLIPHLWRIYGKKHSGGGDDS